MIRSQHAVLGALIVSLLVTIGVVVAQEYDTSRYTIDGGGVMFSTGGDFELSGTASQPDAGALAGGNYTLSGGFWFGHVCGDCNYDGGVDLLDFADYDTCLTGPGGSVGFECRCLDFDGDEDVDLADFAAFQQAFTGQ